MRLVVAGAGGGLGRAFLERVPLHHDIHAFARADLDVTDHHAVMQTVVPVQPDLIMNFAAMTAVDACEQEPDRAYATNALGPQSLALAARHCGAMLLHVSTDYVFDGEKGAPYDEVDHPAPISVYGRSKLAGEQHVRALVPEHFIVRTAWVFGGGTDFASKALAKLRAGEAVDAFTDRTGSPTYVHHLAERLLPMALTGRFGTYHVAGPEPVSWFDAMTRLRALGGLPGEVRATTLDSTPLPAARPRFSALTSVLTEHLGLAPMPPLEAAFKEMLEGVSRVSATRPEVATEVVKTSEPARLHMLRRLRELWGYREILRNLTRRELKVKYTSSVLGAAWSMLNPLLYLAVFSLVFSVILRSGISYFAIYLLSGLLAWNFFATSLGQASQSVVGNANLVKKVYFPREILPFASIGAAFVDFVLQSLILVGFIVAMAAFGDYRQPYSVNLLLLPLALLALIVFTAALSLWVSALNVRYRDTQHLLALALLAWFWLTPVVYGSGFLQGELATRTVAGVSLFDVYLANPMASIIFGFQRAVYGNVFAPSTDTGQTIQVLVDRSVGWHAASLGIVVAASVLLLYLFWRTFFRLSGDFAEEL